MAYSIKKVIEQLKDEETVSVSNIQRKCSLGFPTAKKVLDELQDRGDIIWNGKTFVWAKNAK